MFWEKEKEKRIRIKATGIKRIVKIEENKDEKLEDLINDYIMSLEFSEHVLDIKVIENKRIEERGIYNSKEGNRKIEKIYYAAYICVGGKIYV
jgi:hypothetical protein|nr:MAG TPA: hypothetical protein [Caudoviricetes sp.]